MVQAKTVRVVVSSHAPDDSVEKCTDGRLKVSVRARAKAGAANARVIQLLAQHFGVPVSAVIIVRGTTAHHKTVTVYV